MFGLFQGKAEATRTTPVPNPPSAAVLTTVPGGEAVKGVDLFKEGSGAVIMCVCVCACVSVPARVFVSARVRVCVCASVFAHGCVRAPSHAPTITHLHPPTHPTSVVRRPG